MSQISVIIPVFNEAKIIQKNLLDLLNKSHETVEIIVIDGGSEDNTIELCQDLAIKVIISPLKGKANQMNFGAKIAQGDILLFLHIDTYLPTGYQSLIKTTLSQPKTIAGAFELGINSNRKSFRFIERMVNWRSRFLSLPYGDQAIFVKASTFQDIGGFVNLPIMEDFDLIQRLKKQGKIRIAPAKVLTSSRRWEQLGICKTTFINQLIILGYYLKISPEKLAQFYKRE